ncbi:MAG TPA: ABC transporter permease [Actinobacteria bacterium]|nr:ABC transporter permease [Actinomycetota bacterium]
MNRAVYAIREAFTNISRNALVVLGAVLAVFISLSLTFGILVFGEIVRVNTTTWANDVRVIAFLSDDLTPAEIDGLQREVRYWPEVRDVFFVSKAEALEEAKELLASNPAALQVILESPDVVPASIRIQPSDPKDYEQIVLRLRGIPGVDKVVSAGPAIDAMIGVRDGLRILFWFATAALTVAAIALIANTIHMAVYARREEIEIMRLVGASNWFIRTPFLVEGAIEGLVGAVLAVTFVVVGHRLLVDRFAGLPQWIDVSVSNGFMLQWGALVLLFGVVTGLIGSSLSLAVHRHLRA